MPKLQKKGKFSLRVLFNSSSEQYRPQRNKMWFTLSWPRRGFHHSVTVRMPTRSMVHETVSFYWHGIQSVPLGYMSLALQWGPPITALPAPAHILLYAILFNAFPPDFHPSVNTISPAENAPRCGGVPLSLFYCFWLIMQRNQHSILPSLPKSLNSIWVGSMPAGPPTSFLLWPHKVPIPTYTSPLSTSGRW